MNYSELLRDPRWQKKRLSILDRDNFTCKCCGESTIELHVHHCIYMQNMMPWDYPDNSLITLCKDCHKREEELKKCEIFESLLLSGFPRIMILKKVFDDDDKVNRIINHFIGNG